MFQIEVADLVIRIENRFDYVHYLCAEYETSHDRPADVIISVSESELKKKKTEISLHDFSDDYCESVVICGKISNVLPKYNAFIMHSSAVAVNGEAYSFAARSGVGKSTHTRFWKEVLGDRVTVINGDKPIYRFKDDRLLVYGSP